MGLADAAAVARLSAELGYPCTASAMRQRIGALARRRHTALFVAESDGAIVGWVQVESRRLIETGAFAELTGLVVAASARGRGVGRALVAAAEAWAGARGFPALRLRSNVIRTGARAFYERLGYRVVKRQNVFVRPLSGRARAADLREGGPPRRRR